MSEVENANERIRFKGEEFLLVGDRETGGAIATPEAYEAFAPSYAHYFAESDEVKRYGTVIGTGADIEWLGAVDDQGPTLGGFLANFDHPGWSPREAAQQVDATEQREER